jgi:hypothetical protein
VRLHRDPDSLEPLHVAATYLFPDRPLRYRAPIEQAIMTKRFVERRRLHPMRVLTGIAALLVVLAAAGCVTCHCQPVVNGDCTCQRPAPGATR